MDKCFACPNNAEYMLPCYHKICGICLNDIITDGICLCYPTDDCDKQCLTKFKQDDVMLISNNNDTICVDVCPEHNEEYTKICSCDNFYCDKCDNFNNVHTYDRSGIYTIMDWKKQTLQIMENYKFKLNNKVKGLNCIIEIIHPNKELHPITKQLYDIVDTILIKISHIENFNQLIDNLSISNIRKRKEQLLISTISMPKNIIKSINKNLEIFEYVNIILKNGIDINTHNDYVLTTASKNGNLHVVECLIKYGANANNNKAFINASYSGNLDIVELLIKYGADIHARNEALCYAAMNGKLNIIEYLISHGAGLATPRPDKVGDIHANNGQALHSASMYGHLDIVEYLISHGVDIHANNESALMTASKYYHLDIVKYLISHGADVSVLNKN
jgi:hypothetical protein